MGNIKYMRNGKEYSSFGAMFYGGTGKAWQQMTYLYYMTPNVIVSSLFNGDIPAFLVYNARKTFIESLNNKARLDALLKSPIGAQLKRFIKDGELDGSLDNDPKKFQELLDILKNSNDPLIAKLAGRTEKVVKVGGELAFRLSPFKGISDKIGGWLRTIDSKVGGRFRKYLADNVLKKLLDNAAWQSTVEQFVANNIGAFQMVRVFVQEAVATLLEAIGIGVGGPVGAALAFVISEAATSVVFEVAKGLMQLMSIIVILMLALMAFIFFYGTNVLFHNPIASAAAYRYVVPGTANQCTNYNPDSVNYVNSGDDGGTDFPPVNSTCPFTFSPQTCTQGDGPTSSSYHQLVHAMDVGTNSIPEGKDVWYAPTDGKITKYDASNTCSDGSNYGGVLYFTDTSGIVYVLMHVRAVGSVGGKIEKGHAVAVSLHDLTPGYCWTGPHFHVEVIVKGSHVQAEDWYKNKLKCPISSCSQ